jgi:hypothetical protein
MQSEKVPIFTNHDSMRSPKDHKNIDELRQAKEGHFNPKGKRRGNLPADASFTLRIISDQKSYESVKDFYGQPFRATTEIDSLKKPLNFFGKNRKTGIVIDWPENTLLYAGSGCGGTGYPEL